MGIREEEGRSDLEDQPPLPAGMGKRRAATGSTRAWIGAAPVRLRVLPPTQTPPPSRHALSRTVVSGGAGGRGGSLIHGRGSRGETEVGLKVWATTQAVMTAIMETRHKISQKSEPYCICSIMFCIRTLARARALSLPLNFVIVNKTSHSLSHSLTHSLALFLPRVCVCTCVHICLFVPICHGF